MAARPLDRVYPIVYFDALFVNRKRSRGCAGAVVRGAPGAQEPALRALEGGVS